MVEPFFLPQKCLSVFHIRGRGIYISLYITKLSDSQPSPPPPPKKRGGVWTPTPCIHAWILEPVNIFEPCTGLTSYVSRSRGDRWGATEDFAVIFLHPSLIVFASPILVHSRMLSSHLFFCLPLALFPGISALQYTVCPQKNYNRTFRINNFKSL